MRLRLHVLISFLSPITALTTPNKCPGEVPPAAVAIRRPSATAFAPRRFGARCCAGWGPHEGHGGAPSVVYGRLAASGPPMGKKSWSVTCGAEGTFFKEKRHHLTSYTLGTLHITIHQPKCSDHFLKWGCYSLPRYNSIWPSDVIQESQQSYARRASPAPELSTEIFNIAPSCESNPLLSSDSGYLPGGYTNSSVQIKRT